jgi:hypothetical protein
MHPSLRPPVREAEMGAPRQNKPAANGSSSMDIMTSLIGCLLLILLGILVIVLVTEVSTVMADPDNVSHVGIEETSLSGFSSSDAFPGSNQMKEPLYLDMYPDKVVAYPYRMAFTFNSLQSGETELDEIFRIVASRPDQEYVLFLVRPGSTKIYALVRHKIDVLNAKQSDTGKQIEIGVELCESGKAFEHAATHGLQEGFQPWDLQEFRKLKTLEDEGKRHTAEATAPASGSSEPGIVATGEGG